MKFKIALVAPFFCLLLPACGSSPDAGGVEQWLGEETHLAITGTFQDMSFDIHLEGEEAADIYCHRTYAPLPGAMPDEAGNYDTSQVYFVMKELGGVIEIDGAPKEFTTSYWGHDLPAGSELEVIPRIYGNSIPEGQTWSDINVFEPGANSISGIESAASSGSVSIMLNIGEPDAGGTLVPVGGRTGLFTSVSWGPRDNLNVSATADCSAIEVVTWPQSRLLP